MIKHRCIGDLPDDGYGEAIDFCGEKDDGTLWVSNSEYSSQVNFCPYCGYEAKVKAEIKRYKTRQQMIETLRTLKNLSILRVDEANGKLKYFDSATKSEDRLVVFVDELLEAALDWGKEALFADLLGNICENKYEVH